MICFIHWEIGCPTSAWHSKALLVVGSWGSNRFLYRRLMNGSPPCRRISKNTDSLNY